MTEKDKELELFEDKTQEEDKQEAEKETPAPEYTSEEQEALSKGWKPKDQWEGDESDWKPAKVFNEIGALKEKLLEKDRETKKLNKVVSIMKEHHMKVRETTYKQALETLRQERQSALENENFSKAEKIRDQIDELKEKQALGEKLPDVLEKQIEQQTPQPDPAFFEFLDRNPWYKPGGKDDMSREADALGYAYHLKNPDAPFSVVIKEVEKSIRKLYPDKFESPRQMVNDSGKRKGDSQASPNLSSEELEIAKGFGMSPEEYAKELKSYRGR